NLQYVHPLNISNVTRLNTRRITKMYGKKDWSDKMREAILLRRGFWLGSAYAVRKQAILLERFERLIAQHAPENLAYLEGFRLRDTLDLLLGSFIVASNPTFKVGFVDEVLFKHRAHVDNTTTGLTAISVEKALCTIESWQ